MAILAMPSESVSADVGNVPDDNAALKYWQAFATLPRLSDAESQKLIAECVMMPLDDHAREIVANSQHALEMLHNGAALPRCYWGISYENGYYTRVPHGHAARVLCSLACLRARLRFEEGQAAEALDDLVAALTLARHVTADGTLILVLQGYNIEPRMSETLARYLPKLGPGAIKGLKSRLDSLPAGGSPASAMTFEQRDFDWFIRKIKDAKGEDQLLALVSLIAASEGPGRERQEESRALLKECGGTGATVAKLLEELRPCFERMARMLALPLDQFDSEWKREESSRSSNPLFSKLFGAFPRIRGVQARTDARRTLVQAALAVQLEGPVALKKVPDPFDGAFDYVPFAGGFELRSKMVQADNKPVSLTVGRREK
jgi:hypothetical protein